MITDYGLYAVSFNKTAQYGELSMSNHSPLPPSSVGTLQFRCDHLQQQHGEVCSPAYPCSSCRHCGTPATSQPPHALQGAQTKKIHFSIISNMNSNYSDILKKKQ